MAMMRRNYADSDAVVTAREATLAGMTPEDPQYARVDREHREAADRRHYSLTDYTREGESAAETERDMARKLDDICQDLTDPAAYDLFEGDVVAKGNVLANGTLEEEALLKHYCEVFAVRLKIEFPNVGAVEEDASFGDVTESRQEGNDCGLP